MKPNFMFTSESVTEGHPDKLCDQISDAIVDRILRQDPTASVVAECAISTGIVFVAARIGSHAGIDIPQTAREVIQRAGYDRNGFDVKNCTVMTSVTEVAKPFPVQGKRPLRDEQIEQLAVRDQTTAFGYACDHTPSLMPLPVWFAHKLARRLSEARRTALTYLAPDAKTQVGVEFRERRPLRVHSVSVIAAQRRLNRPAPSQLRDELLERVIQPTFADERVRPDAHTRFFINPAGPVAVGGPAVHSGMTGRKTGVDTYGEFARSSASALSGKDPARIDRVGNYAARHAAKNVVAAGLARECELQLSYSIGLAGPVSVQIETFGTNTIPDTDIAAWVDRHYDFRLGAIIRRFGLWEPATRQERFFEQLAVYGHMGRVDLNPPWERVERAPKLRASLTPNRMIAARTALLSCSLPVSKFCHFLVLSQRPFNPP